MSQIIKAEAKPDAKDVLCPDCKGLTATDITGKPWCVLCGKGLILLKIKCRCRHLNGCAKCQGTRWVYYWG